MARLKKYSIMSNYAHLKFHLGGAVVNAEFVGGDVIHNKPAELTTTDPLVQAAIESDAKIFGRVVKLTYTGPELEEEKVASDSSGIEGVTSFQSAQKYIGEKYGVAMGEIRSKDMLRAKCEELGVEFPNYNMM